MPAAEASASTGNELNESLTRVSASISAGSPNATPRRSPASERPFENVWLTSRFGCSRTSPTTLSAPKSA